MTTILTAALLVCGGVLFRDDFDAQTGWRGPVHEYGVKETGDAYVRDGVLAIVHAPVAKWHSVSMSRDLEGPLRPGTWFNFRCRAREMLLGADLYITVKAGEKVVAQFGFNGEQHWIQGRYCEPKEWNDEFFWGSDLIVGEKGGKRTDIRVGLPRGLRGKVKYTEWTLFSLKYEAARLRMFVNGQEIIYRDLDCPWPQGLVDNRLSPGYSNGIQGGLRIILANFTDGDLYSDTSVNNGDGIRWLHAFAANTPALPHPTDPKRAVLKDAVFEWDQVSVERDE